MLCNIEYYIYIEENGKRKTKLSKILLDITPANSRIESAFNPKTKKSYINKCLLIVSTNSGEEKYLVKGSYEKIGKLLEPIKVTGFKRN